MGKAYFFFGGIDRKGGDENGEILSELPAYMHERQIEELEGEKNKLKGQMDRGEIPPGDVMLQKVRLSQMDEKIQAIASSRCIFTETQKKDLEKEFEYIKAELPLAHHTRSEMELSLVDAHIEADRMSKPCVKIKNLDFARECGLRPVGGKITRNEADKYYRILGSNLYPNGEENLNVEYLRRDSITARGSKYVGVTAEGHAAASTKA